jgi:hypothetical protein
VRSEGLVKKSLPVFRCVVKSGKGEEVSPVVNRNISGHTDVKIYHFCAGTAA